MNNEKMKAGDPVRAYLRETGCAQDVIEGGLSGLAESWERLVQSIEDGYPLGLDDYLNDLDVRQLIDEVLAVATEDQCEEYAERIRLADEKMKSLVQHSAVCLWGNDVATEEGWTPETNWWYFSQPINAGKDLLTELDDM